ncbi:unnamed protein product [Notodromas monacha]|uniref:Uncharacterized protein n=1 Tax=Notodromas monacha TaxID=399045 RepID=A0A7R9GF67_9CRUS|nr:unnamed protein product [Notodromas monacha]CAG0918535.1 unnamed protein product [Notodromas monacha]
MILFSRHLRSLTSCSTRRLPSDAMTGEVGKVRSKRVMALIPSSGGDCVSLTLTSCSTRRLPSDAMTGEVGKVRSKRVMALIPSSGGDCVSLTTNHMNKGKAQRDRRKLREKRRSTGVVHLPSTEKRHRLFVELKRMFSDEFESKTLCSIPPLNQEADELDATKTSRVHFGIALGLTPSLFSWQSTGGSTGEDEDEDCGAAETRKNTQHNEFASDSMHSKHGQDAVREHLKLQHTSASDLEADDEENGASGSRSSANNDEDSPARENGAVTVVPPVDPRRSDDVFMLLERSLEENQKLSQMLEARDKEVAALSASLQQLKARMGQTIDESSRLREENAALIKAMGSLSNND